MKESLILTPQRIKKYREDKHFTRKDFATYFGISENTVKRWEEGISKPTGTAKMLLLVLLSPYPPSTITPGGVANFATAGLITLLREALDKRNGKKINLH